MQVVLILVMLNAGSGGGNALATADFQSHATCDAAGKAAGAERMEAPIAKQNRWGLFFTCVTK